MSSASDAPAAGLILAAGAGTRFGAVPKPLADLGGRPLLQWAVDAQCAVDPSVLSPVVVVLGAHAARIRVAVAFGRARTIVCEDWRQGQSASLRCGLHELRDADRVVVTLGDTPFVSAQVLTAFASQPPGVRATYDGEPGHPVVLGRAHRRALLGDRGDAGARRLLHDARTIEVGSRWGGCDVDTPEDLEKLRDAVASGLASASPARREAD